MTIGHTHKNVEARIAQFRAADGPKALDVARSIVLGKIRNQRTMVRRNLTEKDTTLLAFLARGAKKAAVAPDAAVLLGIEGTAARYYFSAFGRLFRGAGQWAGEIFDAQGRNRRPPLDEVNAVLSFLYALLIRDATTGALAVGLDPYRGLFHMPKYGKPALALDLCEEFRPLVADSACITVFNQGEVTSRDFVRRSLGVALSPAGRRAVIAAYERRMGHVVRHPLFGYRLDYRRVLEIQARLLRAFLLDEVPAYVPFGTR
jgi:CRISPR-associated protein Cas1